ncbi:MAG: hypothetical protein PUB97_02840 [Ruminococcus sp.]|nr:hypothetical protein [Ruminococcus sp.]
MKNRLFIIEGLPCSGKSTTSSFVASLFGVKGDIRLIDEGTGNHPADYEFHALAPAGLVSDKEEIVPLSKFTGEMFDKLLQYKIYDFLPWEIEMPIMLDKWQQFVQTSSENTTYIFNCVLLQNPMCETMMRFGFSEEESEAYIRKITDIIQPMNPIVIYLENTDIADSVEQASKERPGWLDGVINYHVNGSYGKQIGAKGFEGYIHCLEERQERELRILNGLPVRKLIINNPQRDWNSAQEIIKKYLMAIS